MCVPESKDSKGKVTRQEMSRLAQFRKSSKPVPWPEVTAGAYLIDALLTIPPTRTTDMGGQRPADWGEIMDFARATGRVSDPLEIELLHAMCMAYAQGARLTDVLAFSPFEREARAKAGDTGPG